MDDRDTFLVLHALRIRGLATADDLAETTAVEGVAELLSHLVEVGDVARREGRMSGYALTGSGRQRHEQLLAQLVTEADRVAAQTVYETFVELNGPFKAVCTRWQVRDDGAGPNDHTDAVYDQAVVASLEEVHGALLPVLSTTTCEHLAHYPRRFGSALRRLKDGDRTAFARPMSGSYHDVWMELHQDLMSTLGRERGAADGH